MKAAQCSAAHEHGYHRAQEAMSGLTASDHAFAVQRIFPLIGRVASTNEVAAALR